MAQRIANVGREAVKDDLADSKEGGAEKDVADRPPVVQRAQDQNELEDDVDDDADKVKDVHDDPEREGFGGREGCNAFECGDGEKEDDAEDGQARQPEELPYVVSVYEQAGETERTHSDSGVPSSAN